MNRDSNILFVGYGVIGKHEAKKFKGFKNLYATDISDEIVEEITNCDWINYDCLSHYDICFICVPTPTVNGYCDTSIVTSAIMEHSADIYVVMSTVEPGTCQKLSNMLNNRIVFSPESYGATPHAYNFESTYTILGGDQKDCHEVQQLLQEIYDARHQFVVVDSTTAELTKYMWNSYLAMKVDFCAAYWEVCKQYGVDYDRLRECFITDPRINSAHTFIYDNHPYYDSHCFNKDVPAIANRTDNQLLKAVVDYNHQLKNKYKK